MKRVLGIGGIFFKARDPEALAAWYARHLGLEVEDWGGVVFRPEAEAATEPRRESYLTWSPFPADTEYFAPSAQPFMINFRVAELDELVKLLRAAGVTVEENPEASEFGRFAWVMDPEGNRVELWEPPLAKGVGSEGIEPPTNSV